METITIVISNDERDNLVLPYRNDNIRWNFTDLYAWIYDFMSEHRHNLFEKYKNGYLFVIET